MAALPGYHMELVENVLPWERGGIFEEVGEYAAWMERCDPGPEAGPGARQGQGQGKVNSKVGQGARRGYGQGLWAFQFVTKTSTSVFASPAVAVGPVSS